MIGAAVVLAFVAINSALFAFMSGRFKAQQKTALAFLRDNPRAVEALGMPIEAGWLASGKVSTKSKTGCALLDIPVTGSRGSGSIYYSAIKSGARWFVLHEYLTVDDKRIVIVDHPDKANFSALTRECRE